MSDGRRTVNEYLNRYAVSYCNGNVEQAKSHAIVKEVIEEINRRDQDEQR